MMKKMFFYINTVGTGGAERVMVNLADFFSEKGYDVTLITSFPVEIEYPVIPSVRRISLEDHRVEQSRIKRNITRITNLRKICKEEKPNILISFMAEPNFRAVLATRGLPVKLLVSVRNDPNKEYAGIIGGIVGKVLLPMSDGCVFQTRDAQKWFPQRLQKKSKIIYNAVKSEFYKVVREPVAGEIVTCGRLTEQKNHELLLRAFSKVVKVHPEATLKIYGDGKLKEQLQHKIIELDLNGKAVLMGATDDVVNALKTANVFVLSSDYEGMPNALMEAMAAGVPCVATDCPCGGPRELFGDTSKDRLVPCGNEEILADKICEVLDGKVIDENQKVCADAFRPEKVNRMWENYVLEIMA